jgi:hypothetical protein
LSFSSQCRSRASCDLWPRSSGAVRSSSSCSINTCHDTTGRQHAATDDTMRGTGGVSPPTLPPKHSHKNQRQHEINSSVRQQPRAKPAPHVTGVIALRAAASCLGAAATTPSGDELREAAAACSIDYLSPVLARASLSASCSREPRSGRPRLASSSRSCCSPSTIVSASCCIFSAESLSSASDGGSITNLRACNHHRALSVSTTNDFGCD